MCTPTPSWRVYCPVHVRVRPTVRDERHAAIAALTGKPRAEGRVRGVNGKPAAPSRRYHRHANQPNYQNYFTEKAM